MEKIRKKLMVIYFFLNATTLLLIILLTFWGDKQIFPSTENKFLQFFLIFFSVLTGFILPMWLRIYNFNKYGKKMTATLQDLYKFEIMVIFFSWIAFSLTIPAFGININKWVSYFITFVGFYSLYYSFPGRQKLNTDKKLFSLK